MDNDSPSPKTPANQRETIDADDCDESVIISATNGRKLTSIVWKNFEQVIVDGVIKAKCGGCKKLFVGGGKSGTTHLKDHMQRCVKVKNFKDIRQQFLQASAKGSGTSTFEIGSKFKFNQQVSRNELVNMIVFHEYPLSIVDHIGFRRYSHSLNPEFKMISRNTVKADVLRDYKEERRRLEKTLAQNKSRIAITSDMWSCKNQRKGYMAVTVHYIDDDWVLQNKLIRFLYLPCPHNKYTISKTLVESLKSFNLDEKISTITLDNCSTNDAVIDILLEKLQSSKLILGGYYLHMRCCAHILNLVVNDGLEIVHGAIEKIRSVVAFCTVTPNRYEKFEDACNYCRIPITKKLELDCKTRWNSCFEMLQVALLYKDAFTRLDAKVGKKGKEKFKLPTKEEWKMASDICDRLALFSRATEAFSGKKYPTANLYFEKVCEIRLNLRKWLSSGNKVIESMANAMIEKFDKYWEVVNGMLSVASILDPRRKLDCVSFYFNLLYGEDGKYQCDRIERLLNDLVNEYGKTPDESGDPFSPSSTSNSNGKRPLDDLNDVEGLWEKHISNQPLKKPRKCELEIYLEEERLVADESKFNLLAWWNAESSRFPILSKIARDVLAVPISTVASESAFSTSGRVIGPHRSRLLPDTVEALMCLQSWRRSEFKDTSPNYLQSALIFYDEDAEVLDE